MRYFLKSIICIALVGISAVSYAKEPATKVNNIIYMIGDGMGVPHVTQLMLVNGGQPINMQRAQAVGLVRTHSANNKVTDSAAGGTALATGTKTANSTLGMDTLGNDLVSILTKAAEQGMATGFVVTCVVTHATPAAFYSHSPKRSSSEDIALQLVDANVDVFMGGGNNAVLRERKDSLDLIKKFEDKGYNIVYSLDDALKIEKGKTGLLIPSKRYLKKISEGRGDYLTKATEKTLDLLTKQEGKEGFFLMVEGSMIDWGGHNNDMQFIEDEMRDFDKAVGAAMDYADKNPGTLVVVTADHESGGVVIGLENDNYGKPYNKVEYRFGSKNHSGSMVPLFAYGTGAENFSRILDNTDVPKIMEKLLDIKSK